MNILRLIPSYRFAQRQIAAYQKEVSDQEDRILKPLVSLETSEGENRELKRRLNKEPQKFDVFSLYNLLAEHRVHCYSARMLSDRCVSLSVFDKEHDHSWGGNGIEKSLRRVVEVMANIGVKVTGFRQITGSSTFEIEGDLVPKGGAV